jgi:lipopolysaccharide export LptBFGC system permease protein LptF
MFLANILLHLPDSVTAKGPDFVRGYEVGAWLPFIVFGIIATIIMVKKRKG